MRLPNQQLYEYFIEKDVKQLFHANTVATSMTYITANGLLSRGAVEARSLFQTSQTSDEKDKVVGVWKDIFFDTKDLHGFFPRENKYGPVSFKFPVEVILDENYEIWLTKNNPQYRDETTTMQERYFQSIEELREIGDSYLLYRKMLLVKNFMQPFPLDHLVQIAIDDPHVKIPDELLLWHEYVKAFKSIHSLHLIGKFHIRKVGVDCQRYCYCTDNYLRYPVGQLAKIFLPKDHPKFVN